MTWAGHPRGDAAMEPTAAEVQAHAVLKAALPPYSGPLSQCPKCLWRDADTEWMPDSCQLSPWGQIRHTIGVPCDGPGWLQRRCGRCRYQWAEATEDARAAG